MQLNVRELEQMVAIRCNGLQNELAELKEKYSANVELFKVLERNYTERGIALEAATKSNQVIVHAAWDHTHDTSTGQPEGR